MCVCGGGNGDKLGRRLATLMMGRYATVPFEVALDVDPHVYMRKQDQGQAPFTLCYTRNELMSYCVRLAYNGDPQDTLRQYFRRSSTTASIPR